MQRLQPIPWAAAVVWRPRLRMTCRDLTLRRAVAAAYAAGISGGARGSAMGCAHDLPWP